MSDIVNVRGALAPQSNDMMFCSVDTQSQEGKAVAFKAMNNPDKQVADMVGKTINLVDVFAENVLMDKKDEAGQPVVNPETGEIVKSPAVRVVLIDDKGVSYSCVSTGIFNALQKLFYIYGTPHYDVPVKIEVKQINKGTRRILTLDAVI